MIEQLPENFRQIMVNRPKPFSEFDQVHMLANDCYSHAIELLQFVTDKELLFLGDSDCVSLAILAIAIDNSVPLPKKVTVVDFDKRLLSYINYWATLLRIHTLIETCLYNVLNPVFPNYLSLPNFFHINPPFGSRNGGRSVSVWLSRAADMSGSSCIGCIILADNRDRDWCVHAQSHILNECRNLSFSSTMQLKTRHRYDSPWDPKLRSRGFIFTRKNKVLSSLWGKMLSNKHQMTLYGDPVIIPDYIDHDFKQFHMSSSKNMSCQQQIPTNRISTSGFSETPRSARAS